jgi:hypothetical protein
MLDARQAYLDAQAGFIQAVAPEQLLAAPGLRALAALYHTFFAPLAYADVAQYAAATAAAEQRYAALPLSQGWHTVSPGLNLVLGSLVLGLALLGAVHTVRALAGLRRGPAGASVSPASGPPPWLGPLVLAAWTLALAAGLLTITLPYQRYYLPLLPAVCLWAALGLRWLVAPLRRFVRTSRAAVPA